MTLSHRLCPPLSFFTSIWMLLLYFQQVANTASETCHLFICIMSLVRKSPDVYSCSYAQLYSHEWRSISNPWEKVDSMYLKRYVCHTIWEKTDIRGNKWAVLTGLGPWSPRLSSLHKFWHTVLHRLSEACLCCPLLRASTHWLFFNLKWSKILMLPREETEALLFCSCHRGTHGCLCWQP